MHTISISLSTACVRLYDRNVQIFCWIILIVTCLVIPATIWWELYYRIAQMVSIEVMDYPLHSPEISSPDFDLFPRLKEPLQVSGFLTSHRCLVSRVLYCFHQTRLFLWWNTITTMHLEESLGHHLLFKMGTCCQYFVDNPRFRNRMSESSMFYLLFIKLSEKL